MIAAVALLALVAQPPVAAASQPDSLPRRLVIRASAAEGEAITVYELAGGGRAVRASQLARALHARVDAVSGPVDRVQLRVGARTLVLTAGAPFARVDTETFPLLAAPDRDGGELLVPEQVVTDVLPRLGQGLLYDPQRAELRTFTVVTRATPERRPTVPPPTVHAPPDAAPPVVTPRRLDGQHGRTVVIDAGHGGRDPGMQGPIGGGPKIEEKDVTLGIALQLRDALRARGATVVMTRTRDTLIALADRGRIANEQRGDLFISIHVNAANPSWKDAAATRGFETYFLADAKSEDARRVAARENESEQYETDAPAASSDPLGFLLSDMAQNDHLRESSRLATIVQRGLTGTHPGPSRGVKQAGFKVLVTASMPAVLVEVGYGTNAAEAGYIASDRGQRAIAAAIADAAVAYLTRADRASLAAQTAVQGAP